MQLSTETYPEAVETMLQASADPASSRALVTWVVAAAKAEGITFTPVQLQVLTNHLIEMQGRAKSGETLPDVDPTMFAEVSRKSLDLAQKVVDHIGHLQDAEHYVLSIHFEAAQNKL